MPRIPSPTASILGSSVSGRLAAAAAGFVLSVGLLSAGIAVGAVTPVIPGTDGTYTGCVAGDGTIKLIDPTVTACGKNQATVTWSQTGPTGPTGEAGPAGETGPAGPGLASLDDLAGLPCRNGTGVVTLDYRDDGTVTVHCNDQVVTGDVAWVRQFGGTSSKVASVAALGSRVYAGGWLTGGASLPGETSAGSADSFLRAYDSAGNLVWSHQFGGTGDDYLTQVVTDGSALYISGQTTGAIPASGGGTWDMFAQKWDLNGNHLWTKTVGSTGTTDIPYGLVVDATGIYLGGLTTSSWPGFANLGSWDAVIVKLSPDGTTELWHDQFGTTNDDRIEGIAAHNGHVYVTGYALATLDGEPTGSYASFVRQYAADGTLGWTTQANGDGTLDTWAIAVDSTGVYVAGHSDASVKGQPYSGGIDAVLQRFQLSDGALLWTVEVGLADADRSGINLVATGSGVIWPGQSQGGLLSSGPGFEIWVLEYDQAGNRTRGRQVGTSGDDYVDMIATDGTSIYVGGSTTGTYPGQASSGGTDAVVLKFAP